VVLVPFIKVKLSIPLDAFDDLLVNNERICQIAVGSFHNFALTTQGTLFGWGNNNVIQCGVKLANQKSTKKLFKTAIYVPTKVPPFVNTSEKIIKVCAGHAHSLVLTNKGSLYSWGGNTKGECGINNLNIVKHPMKIPPFHDQIMDIYAFKEASVAVTKSLIFYAWGFSDFPYQIRSIMPRPLVSPFFLVCSEGLTSLASQLLQVSPQLVFDKDKDGKSALFYACLSDYPEMVDLLLSFGASVDEPDACGNSPLLSACRCHRVDAVRSLLLHSPQVHPKTINDYSPLKVSIISISVILTQLLLSFDASQVHQLHHSGSLLHLLLSQLFI